MRPHSTKRRMFLMANLALRDIPPGDYFLTAWDRSGPRKIHPMHGPVAVSFSGHETVTRNLH